MRIAVICKTCGDREIAVCWSDDPGIGAMLALGCHAGPPHLGHVLTTRIGGQLPDAVHELRLRCLHANCAGHDEQVFAVPDSGVAMLCALAFHSEHEGHPLRMHWDGYRLYPASAQEGPP